MNEQKLSGKDHWYDGRFFDLFVAPNQDDVFTPIRREIPAGGSVLDVGCGTGRLVFQLAGHSVLAHGIDPSRRNIDRARTVWQQRGRPDGVLFTHGVVSESFHPAASPYDDAVISYVLHEIEEVERAAFLQAVASLTRRLILADFRVPRPPGLYDLATEAVEFLAGRDHYRGFRSFVRNGGLVPLTEQAGLEIMGEVAGGPKAVQILMARGRG